MTSAPLSDAQVATYRAAGVVHVPGAVDADTVAAMADAVEEILDAPSRFGGDITEPGRPGRFFQDRHLFPRSDTFRGFLHATPLAAMAAQATDSTTIRAFYDHVFVKEPGTADQFAWHQDRPYWAVDGTQVCSTWVALTPADVESSALEFVSGSHAWGRTFRPEFPALEGQDPDEVEKHLWDGVADHIRSFDDVCPVFEDEPETYEILGFAVEPGDALLFDFRTVHRSGPNQGGGRRAAISWRWLGDDAVWAPKPGADPIIRQQDTFLAPGDRITDDEVFPVVHPASAVAGAHHP
ncbi:MAG: phytanoyl-CoA dioxygenase family protein [Actinomycetota bacterium]